MTSEALESDIVERLGMVPNFLAALSGGPGLPEAVWAFAKAAYLDNPLPPVFKERLFIHLSRFCETRYCIVRHTGFLIGHGRPSGDRDAQPQTIADVAALLRRPLPDGHALATVFARLEGGGRTTAIPAPGTREEFDLFDALTVCAVEPGRARRARAAVRTAVGDAAYHSLMAFITFVRMAQVWSDAHGELAIEADMAAVLESHGELARLLLDPHEAERVSAGDGLRRALAELENLKASLRQSSETLERALQSAGQIAWEVDVATQDVTVTGDVPAAFGFDFPIGRDRYLLHVHPEDAAALVAKWQQMLGGDPPAVNEYRLINPLTGETVWVHSTSRPVIEGGRSKIVGLARNVTVQKQREHEVACLVGELQHRTRNLISVVAAIADRTLATASNFDEFQHSFRSQLGTLARVQGLFFRMRDGERVAFDELLKIELSAQSVRVDGDGAVVLEGPGGVGLRSGTVQTLALVLHELVTNAVRHGALSQPDGRLAVRWRCDANGDGEQRLHLDWKESGVRGPAAGASGNASELIRHALGYQFGADTCYAVEADGVHFTASLPVYQPPHPGPAAAVHPLSGAAD